MGDRLIVGGYDTIWSCVYMLGDLALAIYPILISALPVRHKFELLRAFERSGSGPIRPSVVVDWLSTI